MSFLSLGEKNAVRSQPVAHVNCFLKKKQIGLASRAVSRFLYPFLI
jgi:hypothetical protein